MRDDCFLRAWKSSDCVTLTIVPTGGVAAVTNALGVTETTGVSSTDVERRCALARPCPRALGYVMSSTDNQIGGGRPLTGEPASGPTRSRRSPRRAISTSCGTCVSSSGPSLLHGPWLTTHARRHRPAPHHNSAAALRFCTPRPAGLPGHHPHHAHRRRGPLPPRRCARARRERRFAPLRLSATSHPPL